MAYTLYYFPIRGRGEQIRLLFHALEVPFEDRRINREEFGRMRAEGVAKVPFLQLPFLDDDGFQLPQGPAILRYVAQKHGIVPSDPQQAALADAITIAAEDLRTKYFATFGGEDEAAKKQKFLASEFEGRYLPALERLLQGEHFVGGKLTHADVAVWDVVDAVCTFLGGSLEGFPKIAAHREAFAKRPSVAKWLEVRPAK
jgi:glutathione S-transferase